MSLKRLLRLGGAWIEIKHSNDKADPVSVVGNCDKHKCKRNGIDVAFCVIDTDKPDRYHKASELAREAGVRIVSSTPCFEFWLLLHFQYTTTGYGSSDSVIMALKEHISDYQKDMDFLKLVEMRLGAAIDNAKKVAADNRATGATGPATDIHVLVEHLLECRQKQCRVGRVDGGCPAKRSGGAVGPQHCIACPRTVR